MGGYIDLTPERLRIVAKTVARKDRELLLTVADSLEHHDEVIDGLQSAEREKVQKIVAGIRAENASLNARNAEMERLYYGQFDPDSEITGDKLVAIGWEDASKDDWPLFISPHSDRCGPTIRVMWEPVMGCDAWRLDGSLIPPPDTMTDVLSLCRGLGIPTLKSQPADIRQ